MDNEERLVTENIGLVYLMVNKTTHDPSYNDEYISAGMLGLLKAAKSYKTECKVKFTTYATTCIRNEILMTYRQVLRWKRVYSVDHFMESKSDSFGEDNVKLTPLWKNTHIDSIDEQMIYDEQYEYMDTLIDKTVRESIKYKKLLTERGQSQAEYFRQFVKDYYKKDLIRPMTFVMLANELQDDIGSTSKIVKRIYIKVNKQLQEVNK